MRRALTLIVAAVVLYGVAPAILEVFGAYHRLRDVDPGWWIVVLGATVASNWCMCALQRLTLSYAPWFPVVTSQLAGGAFSKVVPGGSAAAAALQARMLAQAGLSPAAIGTGLTAGALLLLCALAGLPLLALPALLFGRRIPTGLLETAGIELGVFVALFGVGALLLSDDRVLSAVAAGVRAVERRLQRWRKSSGDLSTQLLTERDRLRRSLGRGWPQAVATAAGRWIFDFLCLYAALVAVGARPALSVALLAYSAAQLLGQIPITPGGLGVVEAGLTGLLALAGVAAAPAAVATLAYRLASYWLPLPAGLISWFWHRRRYGPTAGEPPPQRSN
ncbi:MAG TPA: lysylphosphatidylglycerol synthase transmembrane domain-containing protein [Solirubrobacteraceae bacterium]|nr:lysylphosphatidylglycerol synthase transmembrane domain-containing protein [Solirubrobacteraceae bacterium]